MTSPAYALRNGRMGIMSLGAPIPWNGSKRWISRDLQEVFAPNPRGRILDVFCGSGTVSHLYLQSHPESVARLSDANPWLVGYLSHLRTQGENAFQALPPTWDIPSLRSLRDADLGALDESIVALRFAVCLLTSWGNRWICQPDGTFTAPMIPEAADPAWVQQRLPGWFTHRPWMSRITCVHEPWTKAVTVAGPDDLVYLDPPYPETMGYGNQPWTIGDLLDLVDWTADTLRDPNGPLVVVSNVAHVERLFTRLGMHHRVLIQGVSSRTKRARQEVLAWSGRPVDPTESVLDLFMA